jgi:hypothetical protein
MYRSAKPLEELALDLLFESHGESRHNRTPSEYAHLSALVTNLKDAEYRVNKLLKEKKESGRLRWMGICYFQPNDLAPRIVPVPDSISIETIRSGLIHTGFREPKWHRRAS